MGARQIRQTGRGLLDVRWRDEARFPLRRHWNRQLMCRLTHRLTHRRLLHSRPRPNVRHSALSRSKGRSRWVVGDRPVERIPLRKQFYRHPHSGLAPYKQNHQQQMQQQRLHERGPRRPGGNENIAPETCRPRGDRDLRDSPRKEQVRQIAEEHAMARFQFDQQPETGYRP
jgi:hypothetical protein